MSYSNGSCYLEDAGDPDIAGLGVIIAFLIAVCLTAIIIVILYFRRGLAPRLYNSIDDSIIAYLSKIRGQELRDEHDPLNEALQDFLFVLSDQQLAGGLSLAVVIYIRFAQADAFSTYSFQMATTTVFMSCLTHMSTLAALPDKFSRDGGHIPRLIAMILLAVLMIPILVISNLPSFVINPRLSCKCAWKNVSSDNSLTNAFAIMESITISMMVIFAYESRIKAVVKPLPDDFVRWYIWRLRKRPNMKDLKRSLQELKSSFLWELISITFYYTYGLPTVISNWTIISPLGQWSLSFGQLLPAAGLLFSVSLAYGKYRKGVLDKQLGDSTSDQSGAPPPNQLRYPQDITHKDGIMSNNPKDIRTIVSDSEKMPRILENDKIALSQSRDINNQKSNTHVDSIEASASPYSHSPGHKQWIEGRDPAFIEHETSAPFHAHYSEEKYTIPPNHVLILTTATLLTFFVQEFIALLLGGVLDALGATFLFYSLFLIVNVRVVVVLVVWLCSHKRRSRKQ